MDFLVYDAYDGVTILANNARARDWFTQHVKYDEVQRNNDGSIRMDAAMAGMTLQLILYYGFRVEIDVTPKTRSKRT